jgi:hypothetical protein
MSRTGHLEVTGGDPPTSLPGFASILFPSGPPDLRSIEEPPCFRDLNLDQVVEAAVAGREEHDLVPFFRLPLGSVEEVAYRHEIFGDLESAPVHDALAEFGERMHRVRAFLALVRKQHHEPEKERWLLDAAALYTAAVSGLLRALAGEELASRGLIAFVSYLAGYVAGDAFSALAAEAETVLGALGQIAYNLRLNGTRVTVSRYEGEPDYGDEIEELFARFRQDGVPSERETGGDGRSMDHVEAQIAQLVARLYPREFAELRRFCSRHRDFVDPTIAAFDREIQFYLAWIAYRDRVSAGEVVFSLPEISSESKTEVVEDGFDVALASKLRSEGARVVCNGYRLDANERLLVVTGPNQGGKTTFARMFGQLHHLAALGVPVPARTARLFLADRIFTHFEREEVAGSLRGRLDDELVRLRGMLESATGSSVVVLNEVFASATLADARDLGTEILAALIARGCPGVCVTFIDELSRLGDATVSQVAQVAPDDPAKRTFEVLPQPADGRAYAWAIARKHGLSYEQVRERLSG